MTDSIGDILGGRIPKEPPEVRIIKNFVQDRFGSDVSVSLQAHQIVIVTRSAALAGTLRMHLHELKKMCQTKKRLVIRIN